MAATRLFLLSIIIIFVSYKFYQVPVPEGASKPLRLKTLFAVNELFVEVAKWLDYFGLVDITHSLRWAVNTLASLSQNKLEGVDRRDTTINGVSVRIYTPHGNPHRRRGMAYFHGGGWIMGNVNTHDAPASYWAREADMVVISVNYRLTPEHSKREGLDDCITVTEHLIRNADKYGVDPERVVVGGDSAGGNYAAGVVMYLKDQKVDPMPHLQLLIYPSFQAIDVELPSYQQNANGPILTKYLLCLFRSNIYSRSKAYLNYFDTNTHVPGYVRVAMAQGILSHDIIPDANKYPPYVKPDFERGGSEIWNDIKDAVFDPYNCPLMAEDHSGLPKAYIFTSQHDPLRDEGYLYAHKLRQDGVDVTHYNCPVCWHGLITSVTKQKDATDIMEKMVSFIKDNV